MIIEKGTLDTETLIHLVEQLSQVGGNHGPSRRKQIEAILEGHLQKVKFAQSDGVPVVLKVVEMGHVRIRSVRALAAQWGVPQDAVTEGIRIKTAGRGKHVPNGQPIIAEYFMTRMHNVGTADEPRRVITLPDPTGWLLL